MSDPRTLFGLFFAISWDLVSKGLQETYGAVETERANLIVHFRKQLGAQYFD